MLFSIDISDSHTTLQTGSPKSMVNDHSLAVDCVTHRKTYSVFYTISSDIILFAVFGIMNCTTLHSHEESSCDVMK